MTYRQALMVICNPESYDSEKVREAAIDVIDTIGAKYEYVQQAQNLLKEGQSYEKR